MTTYIDIHALQSVPPSNLNRDESGSPKTAVFGGVRRHRVSSQSWKKAIRDYYNQNFAQDNASFRTKNVGDLIIKEIHAQAPETSQEEAEQLTVGILKEVKIIGDKRAKDSETSSDSLFLISQKQIEATAHILLTVPDAKERVKAVKKALIETKSLDLALFGRMVASAIDLNVEATSQFAHALSTHAVANEFDFFTAVDDFSLNEHAGAAMVGDVEYNSSTLYRYATINLDELSNSFSADHEVLKAAIEGFLDSFVKTLPSGKQSTFAARTLPEVVIVSVRTDQPVSFVNAFERPVKTTTEGYLAPSVTKLVHFVKSLSENYETTPAPRYATVLHQEEVENISQIAEVTSFADLKNNVIKAALGEQ
jgi:CRISPR system Cascade subunit CasC